MRPRDADPLGWLVRRWQWPYAGAFAACFLLALLPLIWSELGFAAMLIYAQLPAYLLHQLEEHGDDRFRRYANGSLGVEALTRGATFAINLTAVWALMLLAFYLALYVDPAWGLVAVYLTLVNALTHAAVAVRTRGYNPGLITALALFLPLSIASIVAVNADYAVPAGIQLTAIGVAIAGHVGIVAFVLARVRSLQAV